MQVVQGKTEEQILEMLDRAIARKRWSDAMDIGWILIQDFNWRIQDRRDYINSTIHFLHENNLHKVILREEDPDVDMMGMTPSDHWLMD